MADRCSLLTPSGAGAIAVIRLSGPNSRAILSRVFRPHFKDRAGLPGQDDVFYGQIIGLDSNVIDDVLVACVDDVSKSNRNRHSSFDISTHGGVRVVERALSALTEAGASHWRATVPDGHVWNAANEIEREINVLLCRARTSRAVRFLAKQRQALFSTLENLEMTLEQDVRQLQRTLGRMIKSHQGARALLHGIRIALVGPPNSGKSTLFNRLAGRSASVVNSRAGTTLDWVSVALEFQGVPVDLIDTAGMRAESDDLEQKAMNIGQVRAAESDIVLSIHDAATTSCQAEIEERRTGKASSPHYITVINKIDLVSKADYSKGFADDTSLISAKTGAGISHLVANCLDRILDEEFRDDQPGFFTHRQVAAAQRVLDRTRLGPDHVADVLACDLIGRKFA